MYVNGNSELQETKKNEARILELGQCPLCNRKHIEFYDSKRQEWISSRVIKLFLSDKTTANLGVCKICKPKVSKEILDSIWKRIQFTWLSEIYANPRFDTQDKIKAIAKVGGLKVIERQAA